ncbi:MAG: site-specific integrase, partial [Chloroflexi bacterium]|nr:site-specific integrase [Chloroflexota bacterium]
VLHKALATAIKWQLISRNAADGVDAPRVRRNEMQTWNAEEITRFLEAAKDSQYCALFTTALFTGARRNEMLGLRWADVDLDFLQIHVCRSLHHLKDGSYIFTEPKSERSRRTIAISPSLASVLRLYRQEQEQQLALMDKRLADDSLVFHHIEDGSPLRPETVSRAWVMLAKRAGVKAIRFHDARHTHASLLLKQGVHPKIVQERLGHASIGITLDTYSHVAPGLQEQAALRFDEVFSVKYNTSGENEAAKNVH